MILVLRSEEKGTDVNLAAHLVHDAHCGRFEAAALISNDSDLKEAIHIVRQEVGKVVGVFTPHRKRHSVQLKRTARFFRGIPVEVLKTSPRRAHRRRRSLPETDRVVTGEAVFTVQ